MFRRRWEKLDATLVDSKFVRRERFSAQSATYFQEWERLGE